MTWLKWFSGGGAAASTKLYQLGTFLLAKAAENIRGKTPDQPPVYQMRMFGPIENSGVSSIPKRAVEPASAIKPTINATRTKHLDHHPAD